MMKRNIVPLLGIAFVVAIISTGIFYGLFAGKLRSSVGELPVQSIVVAARTLTREPCYMPAICGSRKSRERGKAVSRSQKSWQA